MIERHYGKIVNGKFEQTPRNAERYKNALKRLEGKDFELEIREVQSHATNSQYAYFRNGIIRTCLKTEMFGGWDEQEIINHFTDNFLRTVRFKQAGKEVLGISSTKQISNLSKADMSQFIENVLNWLSMHNISVGAPEDYFLTR